MDQTIFEKFNDIIDDIPIVLIDNSGSTDTKMLTGKSILNTFGDVIDMHITKNYHLMFWSNKHKIINHIISIKNTLSVIKDITPDGQTDISVAFNFMPNEWLSRCDNIYILTDGDVNKNKYNFVSQINKLTKSHPNIKLHIISVEPNDKDYSKNDYYAGNAIYDTIKKNKLTNHIKTFFSYNDVYTVASGKYYINLCNPDFKEGYIPFGDKYFPITKMPQFIQYIDTLVKNQKNDSVSVEKILHMIAVTVYHLAINKPIKIQNDIIDMFCRIFVGELSYAEIREALCKELSNHQNNMSTTFQEYKNNREKVFAHANKCITSDTINSIACCKQLSYITIPIETATGLTIFEHNNDFGSVLLRENKYCNAGIKIGNHCVPVFPKKIIQSTFSNQCLRQWIRAIYSQQYNKKTNSDIILYKFLGTVLKVFLSDVNDSVKTTYINLALVMLDRKRFQSGGVKEIDHLLDGNPPLPVFDKFEKMNDILRECAAEFGIEPYTYWYAIIRVLGNENLIQNQKKYCSESLAKDNLTSKNIIEKLKAKLKINITHTKMNRQDYEYYCYISLDDTSLSGGYTIPAHSIGNNICSPKYVITEASYNLLKGTGLSCPICYTKLDNFEHIGPKPISEIKYNILTSKMFDMLSHIVFTEKNIVHNTDLIEINQLDFSTTSYDIAIPHIVSGMNPHLMVNRTRAEFMKAVKESCGDFLLSLDMQNVCVAGGFCRSILLDQAVNDIDLFIYGLTDKEIVPRFKKLVSDIIDLLGGSYIAVYKSNTNVFELLRYTLIGDKKMTSHKIQIILIKNKTMASILDRFDLDAAKIIFNGKDVYFNSSSYNSCKFMINIVNEKFYTPAYDFRLKKYFDLGFSVVVPQFDLQSFDNEIQLGTCKFSNCVVVNNKIVVTSFDMIGKTQNIMSDKLYEPVLEGLSSNEDTIDTTLKYIGKMNKDKKIINYVEIIEKFDETLYENLFEGAIKFVSEINHLQNVDWYGSHRKT